MKMMTTAQWSGQEASEAPHPNAPSDRPSNKHLIAPNSNSKPNLQSCQFCRKRKIKCDKLEGGCSQCLRAQTECVYPVSQRKGRPRKAGTNRPVPAPTPREAQLLKKIMKLERTITALTGKTDAGVGSGEIDGLVRITTITGDLRQIYLHVIVRSRLTAMSYQGSSSVALL
jgi:hypothetical protein